MKLGFFAIVGFVFFLSGCGDDKNNSAAITNALGSCRLNSALPVGTNDLKNGTREITLELDAVAFDKRPSIVPESESAKMVLSFFEIGYAANFAQAPNLTGRVGFQLSTDGRFRLGFPKTYVGNLSLGGSTEQENNELFVYTTEHTSRMGNQDTKLQLAVALKGNSILGLQVSFPVMKDGKVAQETSCLKSARVKKAYSRP